LKLKDELISRCCVPLRMPWNPPPPMLKLSRLDTAGPDFERRLADLLAFENTQDANVDRVAGEIPRRRETARR
jgi:hypothetical protein